MLRTMELTLVAGLLLAVVASAPSALAAVYDGDWTVSVVTEKGTCDRGYKYNVAVANGQVRYQGDTAVNLSGTVAPNGAVKVSIKFGGQSANGNGRLSREAGAGKWHGKGSGGECSGRWEAERR